MLRQQLACRGEALRRIGSFALALTLVGVPRVVAAAEPAAPPAAVEGFARGNADYARGDFRAAAKAWETAMRSLPPRAFERARVRLALDVSTAMERDFDASGNERSLARARELVAWYGEQVDTVYADPEERAKERARARDRLARIDTKLALAVQEPPAKPEPVDFDTDDGSATKRKLARKHRAMIGGGVGLTIVGVGGLGMIAGGVLTDRNWLTYSGIGVAIGAGTIGPIMIIFGNRRRKAALAGLDRSPRLGLLADRTTTGLTLGGRF